MKRKMIRGAVGTALCGVLCASLLITGCGGSSSGKKSSSAESTGTEAAAAESSKTATSTKQAKARTVITTDGEVDDRNSVLRALLYTNDMDLEGIVLTSSMYHYAGIPSKGIAPFRWTGTEWIYDYINAYEDVYDNLKAHDKDYPTPQYLRSVTRIGNISNKGEMDEVTGGSEFLKDLFLDDDSRTLYVQTWGGTNTTARALKSIEEKYKGTKQWKKIYDKIGQKVVLYIILDQDESYSNYIAKNWSNIKVINDKSNFWKFAYAWQFAPKETTETLKADWCYPNLIKDKGSYMANYSLMGDGKMIDGELYEEQRGTQDYLTLNPSYQKYDFVSEGDTPSFLYLIDTGLRSMEDPTYGGWGGRFGETNKKLYQNSVLDYDPYTGQYEASYTLTRWFVAMQNDFAARVNWTLTDDESKVNHAPTVSVKEGIDLTAMAGEKVTLTAVGKDQDDDKLSYRWWNYAEAGTYQPVKVTQQEQVQEMQGLQMDITRAPEDGENVKGIKITGAKKAQMSFTVPKDAKKGDTIHMIVEVTDDQEVPLTHYQRVIITVK